MQIIVNKTDFDQAYARETFASVLHPGMRVAFLPVSYDYGYATEHMDFNEQFQEDGVYRYDVARPLKAYGISQKDIRFINPYEDSKETIARILKQTHLLLLIGENPKDSKEWLTDMGLIPLIRQYEGILLFAGEVGALLTDSFYVNTDSYEEESGLSILNGFYIDAAYEADEIHLRNMIRAIETTGKNILVLPEKSGVVFDHNHIDLFGEAFIAGEENLDEMYQLLEQIIRDSF